MPCQVISDLQNASSAVSALVVPSGLGAADVLDEQVQGIAASVALLQVQLALRMAALEREGQRPCDVAGRVLRAGIVGAQAKKLRTLGVFASKHPDLQTAWQAGTVTTEQVGIVEQAAKALHTEALRDSLVHVVLPVLPPLDPKSARQVVAAAADHLQPNIPDQEELADQAARFLAWTKTPGGGLALDGYLPAAEAEKFRKAIDALVASLRVQGDHATVAQRRADALAAMTDIAGHGLPLGGGLPATLTLTVSLTEAERIALRDPAEFGTEWEPKPKGGSLIGDTADGAPAGDGAVRFGLCCGEYTPLLHDSPDPVPGSMLHRLATTTLAPLAVGRSVRTATKHQRRALQARDGGCAVPGCMIDASFTEAHHVTPWAMGGPTDLDQLVLLCWVHHRQADLGIIRFIVREPGDQQPVGALEHPLWWILPSGV